MSDLCRLRIISFVRPRSLYPSQYARLALRLWIYSWRDIRCLKDERGLSSCHLRLKSALVESLAECIGALPISPECDESCAALINGQSCRE